MATATDEDEEPEVVTVGDMTGRIWTEATEASRRAVAVITGEKESKPYLTLLTAAAAFLLGYVVGHG